MYGRSLRAWVLAVTVSASLAAAAVTANGANKKAEDKSGNQAITEIPKGVKVAPGFSMTLFAGTPEISYPTCLVAAPTGEVFVGSDPNGSLSNKKGVGKIYRLVDTTGSGKADKINVFAENVDSARGMIWYNGTLIVLHPPLLEAFYDENHTGVASKREVLVDGIGRDLDFRGADHTINGIQIGIDGWIYVACGDYGWNKAVGKDGKSLQFRGGGIARVRPDGTELERFTWGQRNIYDVAIDPLMNVYTRDNTNDGDAWNDRLSHVVQYAQMGYPTLFMHFKDETLDALADYGGGSPCGSLFLDEPGFPKGYGTALYTCEWGRNKVYRHPLTANGASFKPQQDELMDIQRPTDMDVDGQGRIYVSSWLGAQFTYNGPNVGFVVRVVADGNKEPAFPDLRKLGDEELLALLSKPSHTYRLHTQHEILRRGDKPAFAGGLEKLAASDGPLATRVAAIFTLKQLRGAKANDALLKLAGTDAVREWALRALADRKTQNEGLPTKPFVQALNDNDPRVRLVALVGLARSGNPEAADAMIPLLGDKDVVVAHTAMQTLRQLHPVAACLRAMEHPESPTTPAAVKVLEAFHEPAVVEALISKLPSADANLKKPILTALCRLYNDEAEWDGKSWWGTRPDTRGPYFKPAEWAESQKIGKALTAALKSADPATQRFLIVESIRHRVELPGATQQLVALANQDASFRAQAVELLSAGNKQQDLPPEAVALLASVATSTAEKPELRGTAIRGLQKINGKPALEASVRAVATIDPKSPAELRRIRDEFVREAKHSSNVKAFAAISAGGDAAQAELAYEVLISVNNATRTAKDVKAAATAAIEQAWATPAHAANLLRAIGDLKADAFAAQVRSSLASADPSVKDAATFAAGQLKLDAGKPAAPKQTIGDIAYEQAFPLAMKEKGDPKVGAELFLKQGCVQCHAISQSEGPKGPYLGDVGVRYPRAELIEAVLKPNAKIAQGFETHWIKLKGDADRKEGFVVREGGDDVEIRDATGVSVTILKKDIDKRGKLETSIMPEGIVSNLSMQEFGSLLAYLESLKNAK